MAKLLEKNGEEMVSALVAMAIPIRNFVEDKEFMDTFRACTKKGVKSKLESLMIVYSDMMPLLFGEKHVKDTLSLVATIEGTSIHELLEMDGPEMVADCLKAWKEQVQPFFMRLGLMA